MIDEKYIKAYFGKQSDYYLDKYSLYKIGSSFSFNIGPFLAGLLWFLYRKLWYEALIIFLILMLYGMIEDWVYEILSTSLDKKIFYSFSSLIFSSVLGFSANYLYLLKSEKKIAAILSKTSNDEKRIDLLKKTGGTSWVPFILVCVILLSLIIVYNFYY